jgi:hypothetical protein
MWVGGSVQVGAEVGAGRGVGVAPHAKIATTSTDKATSSRVHLCNISLLLYVEIGVGTFVVRPPLNQATPYALVAQMYCYHYTPF